MSRSNRKSAKLRNTGSRDAANRAAIERLIEKQRFKDAFKQAKVCFREDGSPENRQLLERTYLLRAQDLSRGQMPAAAAEVAERLLEFGVTDGSVVEGLALLLPQIGLAAKAVALGEQCDSPEVRARLTLKLADRAVLHPGEARPELREGGLQIRAAFAALDAGEEARASELLQAIPRSSPFADWRYFVRGWAAYGRGDSEQAAANWDRLEPSRAAHGIAARLRRTEAAPGLAGAAAKEADLSLLEAAAFGEPVLGRLERLRRALSDDNWTEAIRLLKPLRLSLGKIEPVLAQRLTEVLLEPLCEWAVTLPYEKARRLVDDFTRAAEPLSFDPHWNRFWALLWDRSEGDFEAATGCWRRYIDDLEQLAAFSLEERRRLQAIVWRHLAQEFARPVSQSSEAYFDDEFDDDDESEEESSQRAFDRQRATESLERSLQLDPSQRESHSLAMELFEAWGQPEKAAEAARRLLEAFPDDLEALGHLIGFHSKRDEPQAALSYLARARALKPLDEAFAIEERLTRFALARRLALAGQWDEGRAEFERIAALELAPTNFLSRRAAFEFKAGQPQRANELIREAFESDVEPAELWLNLAIEAAGYELAAAERERFECQLRNELGKKVRSAAAGGVARALCRFLESGLSYPGLDSHVRQVADYLRKSTRTKYQEADLGHVCAFLQLAGGETALFEKLTRRGVKTFSDSPLFLCLGAAMEMQKGPFKCNIPRARKQLEKALAALESGKHPERARLTSEIQRQLSALNDFSETLASMPFARFGRGMPRSMIDMIESVLNGELDEEDGDEFDGGERFFEPQPRRAPRGKNKSQKKSK
ncbi:MAG TPA: hypothetical protein VMV10_04735 [Pirellulales bacterium]|nr:hypothetical protein [Pirellulales bacterium]